MKVNRGFFIAIEGIDGAGKTTAVNFLSQRLQDQGFKTLVSGESSGTPFSREVMNLLRNDVTSEVSDLSRILLINAARADVYQRSTQPALDDNTIVIYDRFLASTKAYQSGEIENIEKLHLIGVDGILPDLTIILDIPVDRAVGRIHQRGGKMDYLESASHEAIEKRRSIMLDWYMKNSDVCELVSADAPIGEVVDRVLNAVLRKIQPSLVYKT